MEKKIIYFDMDGVLVDFKSGIDKLDEKTRQEYQGHLDDVPGIFSLMDPMPGAIEAVHKLAEHYDLYILSTAPWGNPSSWCDKVEWVKKHFGNEENSVFYKRIILSHNKHLCHGDYLIDDRPDKWGAGKFTGELLHFGKKSEKFTNWDAVLTYLLDDKIC